MERERTRRLFGLLGLAVALVVAIVVLYTVSGSTEAIGLAARLEGFLTAVVARAAMELASAPPVHHPPREREASDPPPEPTTYRDPPGGRYQERAGRAAEDTARRKLPRR